MLSDLDKRMAQIEARRDLDSIISGLEAGKDSEWIRNALRVLRKIGPKYGSFTACDIWKTLEALMIAEPEEPRSMAAVITKAKSFGWIESTNMWRTSTRRVNHGRPVRIWKWVP